MNSQICQERIYVRDAQGNILATHKKDFSTIAAYTAMILKNMYLYGSSRLGAWNAEKKWSLADERLHHYKGERN